MIDPATRQLEERVLLLAPTPKDAAMTQRILGDVGIACSTCSSVQALCTELALGAGAVVLTEEASSSSEIATLVIHLRRQPPWSDMPIVVLAGAGANSSAGRSAMELLGNVTVLERPVQMASLVSVVRTLLRARQRQYQIREHLLEREEAAKERERLLVSERAARNEAERVGRVKDEFLATLSHELRTPLNAILGWSQILGGGNRNEEDLTLGLEAIERNARAQTQIIEDLLDMSRIISGKIRLDIDAWNWRKSFRRRSTRCNPLPAPREFASMSILTQTPGPSGEIPIACNRFSGTCCQTRSNLPAWAAMFRCR